MIIGSHAIIYSKSPDADRAFFRDVLNFAHVDVGEGWLIFQLPPSEVAVHPGEKNNVHELYLMCDDIEGLIADMKKNKISCTPVHSLGWGILTEVTLPGGGKLGVYQPRHERPPTKSTRKAAKKSTRRT
jgi:hypothetical protein